MLAFSIHIYMEKSIKIKVIFPGTMYFFRKVKILDADGNVLASLSPGAECHIVTHSPVIIAKIDFYRASYNLDSISEGDCLLLHVKGSDPISQTLHSFTKNHLCFRKVSVMECSEEEYSIYKDAEIHVDHLSVALSISLLATYMILAVQSSVESRTSAFLYGLAGTLALLPFLFRKRTGRNFYFYKMILVTLGGVVFTMMFEIDVFWKLLFIISFSFLGLKTLLRHRASLLGLNSHYFS